MYREMSSTRKRMARVMLITFVMAFLLMAFGSPAYAGENGRLVNTGEGLVYQKDGKTVTGFTGLVKKAKNEWYYVKNGKVDFTKTDLIKNENGWWYVNKGKVDFGYTGFAENQYGTWYVKRGRVAMELTSIVKGKIKGETGWWYIKKGKVQFQARTVAKNENGWWYVNKGKVDFGYTNFASNQYGWWYVKKGNVSLKATGLAKGTVNGEKAWWYTKKSKVTTSQNAPVKNSNGIWYVKNGKIDTSFTGIAKYQGADYYFEKGKAGTTTRKAVSYGGADYNVLDGRAYRVTSEKDRTLNRALKLVARITTEDMTKAQKLRATWNHLQSVSNYREYNPRIPHYKGMDWPEVYANDIFVDKGGNCISLAAAFAYMAKAIGYENVYGCHSGGHGWAEVDGLIYDVEWSRWHHD